MNWRLRREVLHLWLKKDMVKCGKPTKMALLAHPDHGGVSHTNCRVIGPHTYEGRTYTVCYTEFEYPFDKGECSAHDDGNGNLSWNAMFCQECLNKYFW